MNFGFLHTEKKTTLSFKKKKRKENHAYVCVYTKSRRICDHVLENAISIDVDELCIRVIVVELINKRS